MLEEGKDLHLLTVGGKEDFWMIPNSPSVFKGDLSFLKVCVVDAMRVTWLHKLCRCGGQLGEVSFELLPE